MQNKIETPASTIFQRLNALIYPANNADFEREFQWFFHSNPLVPDSFENLAADAGICADCLLARIEREYPTMRARYNGNIAARRCA